MNTTNRAIMSLLALAWIAVLAVAIFLVWDQSRNISFEESYATFNADIIADTDAEQMLASIILVVLMLPALALILFEVMPRGYGREVAATTPREAALQARVDTLQKQLDSERRRTESALSADAINYKDREEEPRRGWRFFPGRH